MNGAQSLIQTLVNGGVEVCFTNPGTSEIHFVAAVDDVPAMRPVLGLFEGVCTGAADGYARMAGKPAATLLHLGPGLANGIANLHNARRANTPLINIIGDHATYHRQYDSPLTSDIVSLATPVSGWVRTSRQATDVPDDANAAIVAARTPPGQVATLILPADCAWNESRPPATAPALSEPTAVADETIHEIAAVLRGNEPTLFLLGGAALLAEGLSLVGRLAQATGARMFAGRPAGRIQSGAGRIFIDRFPYPVDTALKVLKGVAHIILVGVPPPVAFFAYPDKPSWLAPEDCQIHTLARPEEDILAALKSMVEVLNVPPQPAPVNQRHQPDLPTGDLDPVKAWMALAALMPEQAIICDEAITSSRGAAQWMTGAPPFDWLHITGGAIGIGLPMAIGAAVACPDRKVINMQSDGSAMYTVQALWTQARERLDIVTILFANRAYRILQLELQRLGQDKPDARATSLLDLANPTLDWVQIAEGLGVSAARATTAEAFNQQLTAALDTPGPHLIEAVI